MVKDMITNQHRRKKLELIRSHCLFPNKQLVAAIMVFAIVMTLVAPSIAMTNPIYSYTVKNGAINLFSVTIPYDEETLNIASELEGKQVEYIDESFAMHQMDQSGYGGFPIIGSAVKHVSTDIKLRKINFPDSIKEMPSDMLKHFTENFPGKLDISFASDTMIFESDVPYYDSVIDRYPRYYYRQPKITVPNLSLTETSEKINVYVDGVKFEDCPLYDGMTYISFRQFEKTNNMEFLPLREMGRPIMYDSKIIKYGYNTPHNVKCLNEKGEYCEEEFAEYVGCLNQLVANSYTGEIMIMEYYADKNKLMKYNKGETTAFPRVIPGGEIKIIETPIFPDYVPLRAAYEGLGFNVEWDETTKTVYVTSPTE